MSIQAILTNFMLRHTVRPKAGATLNVAAVRKKIAKRSPPDVIRIAKGIERATVAADAERGLCGAEWLKPADPQYTVIYFHGGGYFFGGAHTHRAVGSYLAKVSQASVLIVDYRLAPENPYPAAVDDAVAWYAEMIGQGVPPEKLIVAGDSAGGGLAVACLLAARQRGLPMPAGTLLFSPWVDLACLGETYKTMAKADVMFTAESVPRAAALYLNGVDPGDPLASPLYADLGGLPPMQIFASRHEILLADSTRLHERALAAGVKSSLTLKSRLPHVWPVLVFLPEARESLRECAAFIRRCCAV